ncbi:metallophosphoesterase [Erysipelothrix urinaevulpis]|uniref:metallophosphoesterase n=1 Tax=Erysipelothrix urinaevulpis TaxID=2683717 RepID=UPI001356FA5D|nr:metallophosphoesterase [Erysipelothrix urinaevulpis]
MKYFYFGFIIFFFYSMFEYYNLKTTTIKLSDYQRYHQVPVEFKGKKIIFISDIQFDHHIGCFDHLAARRLIRYLEKQEADVLLLGGDIIHNHSPCNHMIFDYLEKMDIEKYAILGNHDYRDLKTVLKGLEDAKIHLLKNESINLFGLNIYGIDDFKEGKPLIKDLRDDYTVLLAHNPDFTMKVDEKVDLILSGHFHGGQITFFGLFAPAVTSKYGQKFRYGHVALEKTDVYVSSGVGGKVIFFPLRFFARPEIVVLEY